MQSTQAITKNVVKSAITVDKISASENQKAGTLTAQLRQVITTNASYPSKRVGNEKQDSLFGTAEFGFTTQDFSSVENRVAFMHVPVGTTAEVVLAKLAQAPQSCLYKELSNKPIITEDQNYSITVGQNTLESFANTQVVRYPDSPAVAENLRGKIILDNNGKVQYRRVFYSSTPKEDVDGRTADVADAFISGEIQAELASMQSNATIVNEQKL